MRSLSIVLLATCLAAVSAVPEKQQKIVGGSVTTIEQYPFAAALLYSQTFVNYRQTCVGTIINNRSILTAAQCLDRSIPDNWRIRVGSTWAHSGGRVHYSAQVIVHRSYNRDTLYNNVAILRSALAFSFSNSVQAASIAGTNYNVADNVAVWAIGWGSTSASEQGSASEQLQHVQVRTVNQAVCRSRYSLFYQFIPYEMFCTGLLDVGGRGVCVGDNGGPVIHNNITIGVTSYNYQCGHPAYPDVNVRVNQYTSWIQSNA